MTPSVTPSGSLNISWTTSNLESAVLMLYNVVFEAVLSPPPTTMSFGSVGEHATDCTYYPPKS